jgi:uncharacterized protein YciI
MNDPQITMHMMKSHASMASMLGMQLYLVQSVAANGLGPVLAHTEAHLAHQVELERKGTMFAAGPVFDDDDAGWNGDGLFVIRASSKAEAEAIAASDPMHQSGARQFSVRPWLVNEGSLSVTLSFSNRGAQIA